MRAAIYRHTGCGMNACNQSAQMVWLERHAPEMLERGRHRLPLQGLALPQPHRRARHRHHRGHFHLRRLPHPRLRACRHRGARAVAPARTCCRPWSMGPRTTHPLTPAAAAAIGLPAGTPVALGVVDVVCTALGAGLYEPGRRIGCSIVGSTGMHMRLAPDAAEVELAAEPSGYVMSFPVPGAAARMQSNMAATLNVDWIADMAREAMLALGGPAIERRAAAARAGCARAGGAAGGGAVPPLYPRGGRAGAVHRRQCPCPAHRPLDQCALFGPRPCRL